MRTLIVAFFSLFSFSCYGMNNDDNGLIIKQSSEMTYTGYVFKISNIPNIINFVVVTIGSKSMLVRKNNNQQKIEKALRDNKELLVEYKTYNLLDGDGSLKINYIIAVTNWL